MNSSEPTPSEAESPAPSADEATTVPPVATANETVPTAKEPAPSEASPPERVEKVRKIYVRDLQEKERIETVFLVTKKARNVSRTGKVFLSLVLSDKTGDVDARIFDRAEEHEKKFTTNDYVLVTGEVISFHGKPQVLVEHLDRLEPEPID